MRPARILSLSTVYPNPVEPALGVFVRSRLQAMAARVPLVVVAPVARLHYARGWGRWTELAAVPRRRKDEAIEVLHPRWLYPPLGGALDAVFLFLQLLGPLIRLRREFPFDLIDAHFAYPDGIAAALLAWVLRRPFLVTLRGNETMHARHRWRGWLIRRALRRAGRVIAVSERLRQFAISLGVDPRRTRTIPNGIDPDLFYPRDRAAGRRKFQIAEGAPVVLSVGALIERKGHHRVVRALESLRREGVEAQLLIAGQAEREGRYAAEIRRVVEELGMEDRVRFLGEVPHQALPELMSAADLVCLASTREGWPNVVHEAQACGTPVVASDVGGVPDMIPSEEFGYVVPVNDPAALQEAIRKALGRDWDRAAIARRARARSWEQVAAEVLAELGRMRAGGSVSATLPDSST